MRGSKAKEAEEEVYRLQAEFCRGMAHPKRVKVLHALKNGGKTVNDLVAETGIAQSNLSQHLGLLRQLGLLETRREGSNIYYSIADKRITEACELVRASIGEKLRKAQVAFSATE